MVRHSWIILLSCLVATTSLADPSAFWPLDEGAGTTTADASGNGKTGTLVNSPGWTTGYSGGALSFDGTNKIVTVNGGGSLANLNATGLTVMAWVKLASGGGSSARIIDKNNNNGANHAGWFLKTNGSGILQFVADSTVASVSRSSASAIALNSWRHVAVSWDGSLSSTNIHIYINGVLADGSGSNGSGTLPDDSNVPLSIGNRPVDLARSFKGDIDEVRVYNQVLSAAAIQAVYGDSQTPSAPTGFTATAVSSTQISLSWSASSDDVGVTGYLVERCQGASCSDFAQIATPTTLTYSDTGLIASTAYRYRVRARDAANNFSAYAAIASATTQSAPDTQAPTAPSAVTATAASGSQIELSWTSATAPCANVT